MEQTKDGFLAIEDGQTFLSREDLDDYREQKIQMAYEEQQR